VHGERGLHVAGLLAEAEMFATAGDFERTFAALLEAAENQRFGNAAAHFVLPGADSSGAEFNGAECTAADSLGTDFPACGFQETPQCGLCTG